MKLITEVSIWDNGKIKKASILNAYAINLILNESATFYYSLSTLNADGSQGEILASGNLSMTGDDYLNWTSDDGVWKFIADKLNLVILGDYVAPVAEVAIEEAIVEEPIAEPVIEEVIEEPIVESAVESIAIVEEPAIEEAPVVEEVVASEEPIVENDESI
jgi:hypothetical protein